MKKSRSGDRSYGKRSRSGSLAIVALLLMFAGVAAPAYATEASPAAPAATARAIFAGGCFWCMEPPFDALPGVISTTAGYIGGSRRNPTYEEVSAGRTGHAEAVEVVYDPARIGYETLLQVFWRNIDPIAVDRQFCDAGTQYRSAIFYVDEAQRRLAEASKAELAASGRFDRQIATEITAAGRFWPAEDYHQNYYEQNPLRYKFYRGSCGRDARLRELWGEEAGGTHIPPR
jgi:peptide-methionine (S)-S-oxide reductase